MHLYSCGDATGDLLDRSAPAHRHGPGSALSHARFGTYTDPWYTVLFQITDTVVPVNKTTATEKTKTKTKKAAPRRIKAGAKAADKRKAASGSQPPAKP